MHFFKITRATQLWHKIFALLCQPLDSYGWDIAGCALLWIGNRGLQINANLNSYDKISPAEYNS
jgi:hypothetical protein